MGQNLKNSYLPHRGELRPHIWGGEPWPTYLQNDPKLERFRDFGTPNLGTPTTITTVKPSGQKVRPMPQNSLFETSGSLKSLKQAAKRNHKATKGLYKDVGISHFADGATK